MSAEAVTAAHSLRLIKGGGNEVGRAEGSGGRAREEVKRDFFKGGRAKSLSVLK